MKKPIFLVFSFYLLVFSFSSNAQTKPWTTTNPFQTDVFIENFGQFDNWAKSSEPIKYVLNSSDKVFFTQHGLVYKINKLTKLSKEERKEIEEKIGKKESKIKVETYYVNMEWEGSNANATIEVTEQAQGYYTFGEKGYENIKAKGYRKLTYKNLYNNIDVEYIIPTKGGIKYSIILHAGADISKVKMQYSGDIEKISKDNEGNIIIATEAGNITDHAPKSFYKTSKEDIASFFNLKDNTVSFKLSTFNFQLSTVVIDPWTTSPTSFNYNLSYDVSSDNFGNIYISGKSTPFGVAKYSNTGSFLWYFVYPLGWGYNGYSKFCINPNNGTMFIGEAATYNNGPTVMKLNSNGILTYTSTYFVGNSEIWVMRYNSCLGQLFGFGGGLTSANNLQQISDTNLINSTIHNINGFSGIANDIASAVMDNNGDFYALLSSAYNNYPYNNHIQKGLFTSNYNPPLAFNVYSGYNFLEANNYAIFGITNSSARANALALNSMYLYSYDGHLLKAWNKTTGAVLDSIIVNTVSFVSGQCTIAAGQCRMHEGIAVDECNNIWVGGHDTVHVFTFNGTAFTTGTPITTNITGEVYDINYNSYTNTIAVCGSGFLSVLTTPVYPTASPSFICSGDSTLLTAVGGCLDSGVNYFWYSNSCDVSYINSGTTVSISPTETTTYYLRAEGNCNTASCISITVIVYDYSNISSVIATPSTIIQGNTTTLSQIGGILGTAANWKWYSDSCGGTLIGTGISLIQIPTVTTTYYIRAEGICNTTNCLSITVTVLPNSIINLSGESNDLILEPNPAKDMLYINYTLANDGNVNITLYNSIGEKVIDVVNNSQLKGKHNTKVDLSNIPVGVYTCKMTLGDKNIVKRFVITK